MNDLFLQEIVQPGDQERSRRSAARRAERAAREERRRRRRQRNVLAGVISLAILGGLVWAVMAIGMPLLDEFTGAAQEEPVEDYPGPGQGTVDVVIPAGATGAEMAQILYEADVVASARAFTRAFAANPEASAIQPGTYRLAQQMRASDVVAALLNREFRVRTQVTIPEGLRVEQILERLASVTAVPVEEFEAAMEDPEALGLPDAADGEYEGWLFGSTYEFEPGTEASEMLSRMINQTIRILDERDVPEDDRERVLTMASLVEREARTPEDRRQVARAIQNRLDTGMKLDIDAAVAYGAGVPGTELTRTHLETDTPYNLYLRAGLPPTPIASPSLVSIDAVLDPAEGDWLFWVTVNLDTGETKFAETYEEHQRNVAELRQWQAENQE